MQDNYFGVRPAKFELPEQHWHVDTIDDEGFWNFHGVGPAFSLEASLPVIGNQRTEDVSLDWGVNAAALFGRQKARTHHETRSIKHYKPFNGPDNPVTAYTHPHVYTHTRNRSILAPNIGGFAGLSVRYPNAKVSIGYRADLFFGAMDGGIDTRKSENVSFYGPFATISIGIGG